MGFQSQFPLSPAAISPQFHYCHYYLSLPQKWRKIVSKLKVVLMGYNTYLIESKHPREQKVYFEAQSTWDQLKHGKSRVNKMELTTLTVSIPLKDLYKLLSGIPQISLHCSLDGQEGLRHASLSGLCQDSQQRGAGQKAEALLGSICGKIHRLICG